MTAGSGGRGAVAAVAAAFGSLGRATSRGVTTALGGAERTRVVVLLASVLGLASADASTVGAAAGPLRNALHISNTDIGLLVTVTSLVAAVTTLPFVILALPAFVLAWLVFRLHEPARGGADALLAPGARPAAAPDEEPHETDAQRLSRERGLEPDPELVLRTDPRRMGLLAATRYVLSIRTNIVLIVSSACGYYFLAGVQTFGVEFVTKQYGIAQVLGTLVLLVVGAGAVIGVLAGGSIGDRLLRRGYLNGRILVSAISATAAVLLFVPAIFSRSAVTALPYITLAALALSAQNPPLDAARLDIMVPLLWGRAEGVRTFLRTTAQAL